MNATAEPFDWAFLSLLEDAGLDEVDGTITGVKALDRSDGCNRACCSFAELP